MLTELHNNTLKMLQRDRAGSRYIPCKPSMEQFPAGLRVLVVDDDIACLKILEQMLRRCLYTVTLCSQATFALKLLRERTDCFDMVLSDVHMPDMDGYKLLEHVGLEMDLPVIMMSADESTSAVMKGISHGACDYLIKPIRQEELKNLWQHVARKRWNETKSLGHARSPEVDDQQHGNNSVVFASSVNENAEGSMRTQKAKRNSREDDDSELDNDDPSSSKKPRIVWSVELHQQFVNVVNKLGLDKAVPKRILELMNVPGLTRENVASHLQKFRLYLKRLSGVGYQGSICNSFYGPFDPNARYDVQALSASGQLSSQTLAALHAELLGYTAYDQSVQTQTDQRLLKYSERQRPVSDQDGAQVASSPSKLLQPHIPAGNISSRRGAWQPGDLQSEVSGENQLEGLIAKRDYSYGDISRQQQQHWRPALPENNRSIFVQPSCVVAAQTSSTIDAAAYDTLSSNQVSTSSRNLFIDHGTLGQQSPGAGPYSALDLRRSGIGCYPIGRAVSPSISSCQVIADSGSSDQSLDKESYKHHAAVPNFPSRFAVEVDQLLDTSHSRNINGFSNTNCVVKAEPDLDWGSPNSGFLGVSGFEFSSLNDLSHIL